MVQISGRKLKKEEFFRALHLPKRIKVEIINLLLSRLTQRIVRNQKSQIMEEMTIITQE